MTEQETPIDGAYPKFGQKVREVLRWGDPKKRLSVRVAARKSGISHATIANMARGDRPSLGLVIQFARGMGVDINELLAAAGYEPIEGPIWYGTPKSSPLEAINHFFDPHRFYINSEIETAFNPKDASGNQKALMLYEFVASLWEMNVKTLRHLLIPGTNEEYKAKVIWKYLKALDASDETVMLIDQKFARLQQEIYRFGLELVQLELDTSISFFEREERAAALWGSSINATRLISIPAFLAMVGWYEELNDTYRLAQTDLKVGQQAPPSPLDLFSIIGTMGFHSEEFNWQIGQISEMNSPNRVEAMRIWAGLLEVNASLWVDRRSAQFAIQDVLAAASRDSMATNFESQTYENITYYPEPEARVLMLVYYGVFYSILRELEASRKEVSPGNLLSARDSAYATYALMDWQHSFSRERSRIEFMMEATA